MINLTGEERVFLYTWFNNLLGNELSETQLQQYNSGMFQPLFELFKQLGFSNQIHALETALTELKDQPLNYLELAADYAQLFLLDSTSSALPYASAYLEQQQLQDNLQAMDKYLKQYHLAINKQKNEPSDHLCVYLEVLIKLIEQKSLAKQQQFIQQQLLSWLPEFIEKALKIKVKSQFYPQLLQLFFAFIQHDLADKN
ncbi:molecular chaperone TorD [Mergibacter septicus]|uniref:Chaperone protein TorD n=1 Tax=Mergibacter septicus TaxID=221402 RepID=A0A8D4IYI0_9PAST|nr:molecular chaperone TorD [Mergibacter septicus]AWX14744.1 molecular chaperone TorD [Mergibacter septicus]QDJ13995.1 molecular chaperone TorD [Mergibacter septicus]UTU48556.1 molecular chaperone TorD [Mergibacter septicus]WMR95815.1 molecular chaperone TorD [Mergibacter septicus]